RGCPRLQDFGDDFDVGPVRLRISNHALNNRFWIPFDRRAARVPLVLGWKSPAGHPAVPIPNPDFALIDKVLPLEPRGVKGSELKRRIFKGVVSDVFDVADRKSLK